jgi:hypothetical protein
LRTVDTYISQLRKALIQDGETDPSEVPAIDSLKHARWTESTTNNSGGDMQTVPFPAGVLLPAPLRSSRRHLALRSALVSGLELAVCSGGSRGFLDIALWSRHEGN